MIVQFNTHVICLGMRVFVTFLFFHFSLFLISTMTCCVDGCTHFHVDSRFFCGPIAVFAQSTFYYWLAKLIFFSSLLLARHAFCCCCNFNFIIIALAYLVEFEQRICKREEQAFTFDLQHRMRCRMARWPNLTLYCSCVCSDSVVAIEKSMNWHF